MAGDVPQTAGAEHSVVAERERRAGVALNVLSDSLRRSIVAARHPRSGVLPEAVANTPPDAVRNAPQSAIGGPE